LAGLSVRTRVLASVLVMCALGLAVSGAVANAVQTRRTLDAIDAALAQEVEEFRTLATQGVDPDTGERFSSVDQLLLVALQRNVPSVNEMFLTFRNGSVERYSAGGLPELVESREVREAVAAVPRGSRTVVNREVDSTIGSVRLAIVPVGVTGSDVRGTYVIAFAVDRELELQNDLMRTYAFVALGALALVGLVGWLVAGRLLRPLRLLSETTQRISETDLRQRVEVSGADDISDLARTFNAMLDRLETGFEAQRQLIDDAGHELKTPLTVLRGHLELLDVGDPDDVAETRALLLNEIDRMGRLVGDLILLAKAERIDFVHLTPLAVAPFTDEVLEKARGLGEREWRIDARAHAVVRGDQQRLTQALLQLADNAVKYSQPGTTIAIGSRLQGTEVRLWVRDDGPGIRPADRELVFERFRRTETSRGVEGSGLGLAIVRAIAEAHLGRVDVAPGTRRGVTVSIVLSGARPAEPAPIPGRPDQHAEVP
jgi:signal transduction histidine kinase